MMKLLKRAWKNYRQMVRRQTSARAAYLDEYGYGSVWD